jgi:DUF4097 and DUF4098 domain-containing protein YvlB
MTRRTRTLLTAVAVLAAAVVTLSAHDRQTEDLPLTELLAAWPGAAPGDVQNFREEVVDRETHTLAIGASGSLELKTVSGNITCVAGNGTSATVEVVRRARGRTEADARLGLSEIRATVDHKGERASVTAVYPANRRQPPYSVDVSYVVTAPAGTRVSASAVSGDVSVRNIKGDVSAVTVSGDVAVTGAAQVSVAKTVSGDVTLTDITTSGAIGAAAVSGDVRFTRVKAAQISSESVSGTIELADTTTERATLKSVSGDIRYTGAIVRGGRYELQSHSGDVQLGTDGPAGFELQASTFSGSIRTAPSTVLRAATTSSRSVRGTVGDGSAVLVVTTFSGDIAIVAR